MAIAFARLEFVSRGKGNNSCRKASYNGRLKIRCEREEVTFDFSREEDRAHHEILLPDGADPKFKNASVLWNMVEFRETKKNAQTAKEMVLALPDDPQVSLADKITLTKGFIQKHFVDKGIATQIDIHSPHKEKDHNWHAHVLIATRRFTKDGQGLDAKARDLDGQVRKGKVVEAEQWGKLWQCYQNEYFEERGISVRVDPIGIVPQEHLGPVRMRARAFALLNEQSRIQEQNTQLATDPAQILLKLTEKQSLFSKEELESFIRKHVPTPAIAETTEAFWKLPDILQLIDPKTEERLDKFTSTNVRDEENRIIRLSDRLSRNKALAVRLQIQENVLSKFDLNDEQSKAYRAVFKGKRLNCIEGRAGTGKSHLLSAVREAYEVSGYRVRGFAPTSEVARDLEKQGFADAENLHRFLFGYNNQARIIKGREIWIVDEAGMVGNRPLQELLRIAWKNGCQLILVGDSRQLPSIERGGMFEVFCQRYGAETLEQIQRQEKANHRAIASLASKGEISETINQLIENKALHWTATKQEAMECLVQQWDKDQRLFPGQAAFIMEHRNRYAKVLNEIIHGLKFERGELGKEEYQCETFLGTAYISQGDRIQFRANDREIGVINGLLGTIVAAQDDLFVVRTDQDKEISFDPREFHRYQLGYAGTYHRAQGKTVDRAYALHSPWMNRNLFYVGMTRHKKQFHYFVSRDEAPNLAALKFQAGRSVVKETTISYQTLGGVEKERNERSGFDQSWNRIKQNLSDFFYRDKEFYKVHEKESFHGSYEVVKIEAEPHEAEKDISPARQHLGSIKPAINMNKINSNAQDLLYRYLVHCEEVDRQRAEIENEMNRAGKEVQFTRGFKDWQRGIRERNHLAHNILDSFDPKQKKELLSPKMMTSLEQESKKFIEAEEKHDRIEEYKNHRELQEKLYGNIEGICYRIFPEGPSRKTSKELRFRSNHSLSVIISGERAGSYFDFAEGKGGGILELIQKELQLSKKEALSWSAGFLEQSPLISARIRKDAEPPQEKEWISLKPDSSYPAPALKENTWLLKHFHEVSRHAYRSPEGDLLYYVLRLQNKEDPSKKITPPLSFGHQKDEPNKKYWRLKGFAEEKKTLYNAHLLKQNPKATVLVVEGEKTADAATKKFPEYAVVSWPGGSSAASKANWDLLMDRSVIIWPDNDDPGFRAANDICEALKKADAKEIRLVSSNVLSTRFPEKWDLADALPDKITEKDLQNFIKGAEKLDRGYAGLFNLLYPVENKSRFLIEKALFFDRMQMFEKILGKTCVEGKGLNDPIYLAYKSFLDNHDRMEEYVHRTLGLKGPILSRVAEHVNLFSLNHDRMPYESEVRQILDIVQCMEKTLANNNAKIEGLSREMTVQIEEYAKNKVIEKAIEVCTTGSSLHGATLETLKRDYKVQLDAVYGECMRSQSLELVEGKGKELGDKSRILHGMDRT